ncbi:MAG: D-2-hydroxyacid dehydrogenase [Burkholderiales bacterium]|nr:D-2-hydroxyacid dehydrogenase [Burkholderiales bacterium]
MASPKIHVHFDSRRLANPVFHMTEDLCRAALARRRDLTSKVRMTLGWDLEGAAEALATADVFVGFRMPREAIRTQARKLKAIHLIGAGVEHLRPLDWVPPGVAITNNRGIHQQKAGEYMLLAALMLNNRIPTIVDQQRERKWRQLFTTAIAGKTVLIVGAGHLGTAGAKLLRRMGMHVIGVRRSGRPARFCHETHGPEALRNLLPRADIVLLTLPSTAETDGLIGAREFELMKTGAGFISFGRARVADYDAMSESLRSGKLSGAVVDVFDPEPLPEDSPLWRVPNLLITPHCSSDDAQAYIPMTLDLVFENVGNLIAGKQLRNRVNLAREY